MKFNILAAATTKKTRLHIPCLFSVIEAVKLGLEELGHQVELKSQADKSCINILFGYHNLGGMALPRDFEFIVYQLEQFPGYERDEEVFKVLKSNALRTLKTADKIWDFSRENIDWLAERGLHAVYKPIGFHAKMKRVKHRSDRDIDFLFYGSGNDRRNDILKTLSKKYKVRHLFGVYGQRRDEWIGRSKVVLGIHFFESRLFDEVRTSYLMNNMAFTVLEDTPHKKYQEVLVFSDYDNYVETCEHYLARPEEMDARAIAAYELFSQNPETRFLEQALDETFATP